MLKQLTGNHKANLYSIFSVTELSKGAGFKLFYFIDKSSVEISKTEKDTHSIYQAGHSWSQKIDCFTLGSVEQCRRQTALS